MILRSVLVMSIAAIAALSLTSCGKSKKELAAEAERKQAVVAAAASAASAAEARRAEEEQRQAEVALVASFKERVTRQLKDPGSAQFQDLRLNTARSALCGKINAKNSYGGYVGLRDFVASDTEVHIKPEGCGSVPITHWIDRPADGTACINYLMATIEKKLCN